MPSLDPHQQSYDTNQSADLKSSPHDPASILLNRTLKLAHSLTAITKRHGHFLLDKLIPPRCAVTGDVVHTIGQLSADGWADIHFIDHPFCAGCSLPFAVDHGRGVKCANCLSDKHDFETARCAVVYNDASHPLIVSFKHGDRTELAPLLTRWLHRIAGDVLTPDSIIVPVPLHRRRLIARRYNQSALLATQLSENTGTRVLLNAIERHRSTTPQKDLSMAGRLRNVSGAFRVPPEMADTLKNKHIILIDDVLTTGATLSACARVLYGAGVDRVDALVLARVVNTRGEAI